MAAACRYFEEDAVYRINKKGNLVFGLVLENSEFVSSDEEDEKPNKDDEWERVKKGHVRISWHPKGEEEVLQERRVYLADRSLMPGDVVRRVIKGRDTQRGYCRDVEVHSSVQIIGTRQVIYNVDSKDLTPLEEFSVDIAVFFDSWVGMVKIVKAKLYLKCFDGSRCILNSDETELEDITDKRERGTEYRKYDFFVGQQLWGPMHCYESAEWIHITDEMKSLKNKQSKNVRATVEEVKVVSLGVHWQCRAYLKDGNPDSGDAQPQQPKFLLQGDDLKRVKMLNVFEPCTLQLGDRNYYKVKEDDLLLSKEQWRRLQRDVPYDQRATLNGPNSILKIKADSESDGKLGKERAADDPNGRANGHRDSNEPVEANDSEFEDIDDEDGNTSDTYSISSCSSVSSVGQGKKLKNRPTLVTKVLKNKKLKRARRRTQHDAVHIKPGDVVVVETLLTVSSADVVWQDGSVERGVSSTTLYPIHHLDDQEFFPGDFVVENKDNLNPHDYGVVKKVDHSGRTALVEWMKTYTEGADPNPVSLSEQEVSVYDLKDHPDFKYRPGSVIIRVANFESEDPLCTAGQVLDVHPSGKVEVSWVNGQRAFCYPQDLYKVGEYDSEEGELWDDDSEDSDDSWETESELSVCEENSATEPEDDNSLRFKLAANIEKARVSMARLEELFTQNPALQTSGTMKQLLQVYKDCKYLDHLMGTSFFHESHFKGLLQRVRSHGCLRSAQRVAEQVSRLFKASPEQSCEEPGGSSGDTEGNDDETGTGDIVNGATQFQCQCYCSKLQLPTESNGPVTVPTCRGECNAVVATINEESEDADTTICPSGNDLNATLSADDPPAAKPIICAKLCSLLMIQLLKAHEDVMKRFGGPTKVDGDLLDDSPNSHEPHVSGDGTALVNGVAGAASDEREPDQSTIPVASGTFSMSETSPNCHHFKLTVFRSSDTKDFLRAVRKEIKLLSTSLPEGIFVKGYEDRMDLFSFMIRGPAKTPYEDGLFMFDLNLPTEYPRIPPICHYLSYCSDRLNPNLYEDGKVCVSLLGTWGGKGTEMWTSTSNLLQIIVSIQGLILVSEPYFNEAGYERQKGTQQGRENSRMYNEMVILKLVQSMSKLILTPPESFASEILEHFQTNAYKFIHRLEKWLEISEAYNGTHPTTPTTPTAFREIHGEVLAKLVDVYLPEFPLIPASKGFCITLGKAMVEFRKILASVNIFES